MVEEINEYLNEAILHKQYVLEASKIMSSYLIEHNKYDLAIELIKRCSVHDNSKFSKDEMESLIKIEDKSDFKDPNVLLSNVKKEAIEIHWKNNSHHPEHFNNIYDMSDLDLMEMACDCFARSLQYNTDFLDFINKRQENRFKFPKEVFYKYYNFCEILNNGYYKNNDKIKIKTIL